MPASDARSASRSLARVAQGDLCSGCGACAALAPGKVRMALAAPGFLRPVQDAPLEVAEEAAIARTCPGLGQSVAAAGRTEAVLCGPYVSMQTGWATDPDLRFAGASGGGLSALLVHLLHSGRVDAVIQIAADPDNPIGNITVVSTDAGGGGVALCALGPAVGSARAAGRRTPLCLCRQALRCGGPARQA